MRRALALLVVAVSAGLCSGQSSSTFLSGSRQVTIERFDPPGSGEHAAVMVVHGAGGPEAGWRKSGILQALTGAGFVVFAPHYFEAGGKWDNSGAGEKFYEYLRTLNDAAVYIGAQPGVRKDGMALAGFSLGGVLVLAMGEETASHPPPQHGPPIKAIVDNYGFLPEFAAPRLTTMAPVLILHGEKDQVIPVSKAYETERTLKEKGVKYEMQIYPGQGHGFAGEAQADANRRAAEFIEKYLK